MKHALLYVILLSFGFAAGWFVRPAPPAKGQWTMIKAQGAAWNNAEQEALLRINPVTGATERLVALPVGKNQTKLLWSDLDSRDELMEEYLRFEEGSSQKYITETEAALALVAPSQPKHADLSEKLAATKKKLEAIKSRLAAPLDPNSGYSSK